MGWTGAAERNQAIITIKNHNSATCLSAPALVDVTEREIGQVEKQKKSDRCEETWNKTNRFTIQLCDVTLHF